MLPCTDPQPNQNPGPWFEPLGTKQARVENVFFASDAKRRVPEQEGGGRHGGGGVTGGGMGGGVMPHLLVLQLEPNLVPSAQNSHAAPV